MRTTTAIRLIICAFGFVGCAIWMLISVAHHEFTAALFWLALGYLSANGTQVDETKKNR